MMGIAKICAAAGSASSPHANPEVYLSPDTLFKETSNGAYLSPLITAFTSGGTKPYTYAWESNDGDFTLSPETGSETRFSVSGFNERKTATITCTVTDDLMNEASAEINAAIFFGTIL